MMAAQKHGHQPAQRLGWAALAYHKQKGATEGEVLEMEGGIRVQRAEGEPREDKSVSEWCMKRL